MKLKINHSRVWLDDHQLSGCTQVDIKNINPVDNIQVRLHMVVDEVDVQYRSEEIRYQGSDQGIN